MVRHPHARNTSRAYDSDWDRFVTWCKQHRHRPLPAAPPVVAGYLQDAAQARNADGEPVYASATLRRWVAAIADRHRMSQHPSPTANAAVRQAVSAITEAGTTTARPARPAAPLLTADIAAMIAAARKDVTGWAGEVLERRDSALLLMGFAGALGRGGLVAILCGDVAKHLHDGLEVRVQRPNGANAIRLPLAESHDTCPPCATQRWMQVVGAFDSGGRAAVIRLIKAHDPLEDHICRAPLPRTRARAPLFRSIRKNGNLSHTVIRRVDPSGCPAPRTAGGLRRRLRGRLGSAIPARRIHRPGPPQQGRRPIDPAPNRPHRPRCPAEIRPCRA